ncbi:MAG TPA: hypothetical protein PLD48_08695 [Bacillota bacterium]|nr:hypothetical protein [Bacillota bacterium]HOK69375.1 hypothetical protein [Bacillota bacterium]HPP85994.1 hypothetical protein [Bacillota bacterium]
MDKPKIEPSQKYIYIVFISSPTGIGKTIRFFTRNLYSHVAVSFEKNLGSMYSFARYYKNIPFFGGFIEESILRYSLYDADSIPIKICAIPVSDQKYKEAVAYINFIKENSAQYIYNSFSMVLALFHKRVHIGQAFTCLEFANSVLSECGISEEIKPDRYYSIADVENILKDFVIYEGDLWDYDCAKDWGSDLFYLKSSKRKALQCTIKQFYTLTKRLIG